MSINNVEELTGIKNVSEAVAVTLKRMREFTRPGISTAELDQMGQSVLRSFGAKSAPLLTYGFPGATCISVNDEVAHGIPSGTRIIRAGDLVNIDVSAELDGYWADNGGSFIVGEDTRNLAHLVNTSKNILQKAIAQIRGGVRIAETGKFIETAARKAGFRVIRNLVGHGVGRSLHEAPAEIPCYYDKNNKQRFKKNSVVAIETFISTGASYAIEKGDGWTFVTSDNSYVAQHEHTILITDKEPVILTAANDIWI